MWFKLLSLKHIENSNPRLAFSIRNILRVQASAILLQGSQLTTDSMKIKRLFTRLQTEPGSHAGSAHMHNTRGLGLANCLAAYEASVRTFDSSLGGLGGCPHAPGASGNVATEDLVFMLKTMRIYTSVDLKKLMVARVLLQERLPGEPPNGMPPFAGLPKGWQQGCKQGALNA